MLIDTHCHINMMIKKNFDHPLTDTMLPIAQRIVDEATQNGVNVIINVGTSLIESKNCILLANNLGGVYATIGIHPNDCTSNWKSDLKELEKFLENKEENNIVGIGECGIDRHYPGYDLQRQVDAFRAQIELALSHKCALVIHSREAYDETLRALEEYAKHDLRAVMHCFSYDQEFADHVIAWGFKIGIGGPVTYPKNDTLRAVAKTIDLEQMVFETDAPFLPPQLLRGKQNSPKNIKLIAEYIAQLRQQPLETIAERTSQSAKELFDLP